MKAYRCLHLILLLGILTGGVAFSQGAFNIRFQNQTGADAEVILIFDGQLNLDYKYPVAAGGFVDVTSNAGNRWGFYQNQQYLGDYTATGPINEIIPITGAQSFQPATPPAAMRPGQQQQQPQQFQPTQQPQQVGGQSAPHQVRNQQGGQILGALIQLGGAYFQAKQESERLKREEAAAEKQLELLQQQQQAQPARNSSEQQQMQAQVKALEDQIAALKQQQQQADAVAQQQANQPGTVATNTTPAQQPQTQQPTQQTTTPATPAEPGIVKGELINDGPQAVDVFYVWQEDGQTMEQLAGNIEANGGFLPLDLYAGQSFLGFKASGTEDVLGVYQATMDPVQNVDLSTVIDATTSAVAQAPQNVQQDIQNAATMTGGGTTSTPAGTPGTITTGGTANTAPAGTVGSTTAGTTNEPAVPAIEPISPEGQWEDEAATLGAKLFFTTNALVWQQQDQSQWLFAPDADNPNRFVYTSTLDQGGLPVHVQNPSEPARELLITEFSKLTYTEPGYNPITMMREGSAGPKRNTDIRVGGDKAGLYSAHRASLRDLNASGIWVGDIVPGDTRTYLVGRMDENGGFGLAELSFRESATPRTSYFLPEPNRKNTYFLAATLGAAGTVVKEYRDDDVFARMIQTDKDTFVFEHKMFVPYELKRRSDFASQAIPSMAREKALGVWKAGNTGQRIVLHRFAWEAFQGGASWNILPGRGNREILIQYPGGKQDRLVLINGTSNVYGVQENIRFGPNGERDAKPAPIGETLTLLTLTGDGTATLEVEKGQPITLTRTSQEALITDSAWEAWIREDQGPNVARTYAEADLATQNLIEGFSAQLLAMQRPSHSGYHVLAMDPIKLASNPGIKSSNTRIFALPSDKSKRWMTQGTDFRIPWHLTVEDQGFPINASQSKTSMFFSSSHRQESMGFSMELPLPGGFQGKAGYNQSENSMESSDTVSLRASKWGAQFWLILNKRYAELDSVFVNHVENMGRDDAAYAEFFGLYGTHYPLSTLYGGNAWYEKYYTSEKMSKELTKGWSAGLENKVTVQAGAKGVGVSKEIGASVGFNTSSTTGSASGSSSTDEGFDAVGGAGGDFNSWSMSGGGASNIVPIKVDLRPIYDVILPRLFKATTQQEVNAVNARRVEMKAAYERYLTSEIAGRMSVEKREPAAFAVKVDSVKVTNVDDEYNIAINYDPDFYGDIDLVANYRKPSEARTKKLWGITVPNFGAAFLPDQEVSVYSVAHDDYETVAKDRTLSGVAKTERTIVIFPKARLVDFTLDGSKKGWIADYELGQYTLGAQVSLKDSDSGDDETIGGFAHFTLSEMRGQSPISKTINYSKSGVGDIEVKISLRKIGFGGLENEPPGYPDFPSYR